MNILQTIGNAARVAGIDPYNYDGSRVLSLDRVAENLTTGRTHYFDSGTRRYFKSRVVMLREQCCGLVLGFIESVSLDPEHTRRGFRPGFIDADGHVFDRPDLDKSFSTKRAAEKEFWRMANSHDAAEILADMLRRRESKANNALRNIAEARAMLARGE